MKSLAAIFLGLLTASAAIGQAIPGAGAYVPGSGNATQVNGATVPVNVPLGSNASGQLVATTVTINQQTGTSYTIAATDIREGVTFNNAAPVAVSFPFAATSGFYVGLQNLGAGLVTVTPTTGTINGAATLVIPQNSGCTIIGDGVNTQTFACTASINTVAAAQTFSGAVTMSNAAIRLTGLASNSAATTGTVCWTTGAVNLTVDTTLACLASTQRVKQNIQPLDVGLAEVMKLRPVSYDMRPEFNPKGLGPMVGLVAEETQEVDPRLVGTDAGGNPLGVRYMQLTAVLVKAIQDQQHEIDQLKRQLKKRLH
jgi:hypothetical protein